MARGGQRTGAGRPKGRKDTKTLERDPRSGAAHEALGRLAYVGGDKRAAAEHYAKARQIPTSQLVEVRCAPALETSMADFVRDDRVTQSAIAIEVLVRVDQHFADLGDEPCEHVRRHRPPVEIDEPLVHTAHPPALAAGEHDAGDVGRRDQCSLRNRCPPVNSRKCRLVARPIIVMPTFSAIS